MEFPRSADEYFYSSEIGRNVVEANFFKSEHFHPSEIGRNVVQANFLSRNIFIRQK